MRTQPERSVTSSPISPTFVLLFFSLLFNAGCSDFKTLEIDRSSQAQSSAAETDSNLGGVRLPKEPGPIPSATPPAMPEPGSTVTPVSRSTPAGNSSPAPIATPSSTPVSSLEKASPSTVSFDASYFNPELATPTWQAVPTSAQAALFFGTTNVGDIDVAAMNFKISNASSTQMVVTQVLVPEGFKLQNTTLPAIEANGSALITLELLNSQPGQPAGNVTVKAGAQTVQFQIKGEVK